MSKADLKQYPFFQELTYKELLLVDGLLDKGASVAVIYLWYNMTHGVYDSLPRQVLLNDVEKYKSLYPKFENEIDSWLPNSSNQ